MPAVGIDEAKIDVVCDGDKATISAVGDVAVETSLKDLVDGMPTAKDNLTDVD